MDAFSYICEDDPEAAATFVDSVDEAVSRLARFPNSGTAPFDPHLRRQGYRVLVVGSFLVFYLIRDRSVLVVRVLHGKRQYAFLLE